MAGFPFHFERVVQEQKLAHGCTWLVTVYSEVLELQGSAQMFFQDVLNLMCLETNPEAFRQW
jgi:hypothetical protein